MQPASSLTERCRAWRTCLPPAPLPQGRLHLAPGARLVLRNLEVKGTTIGTWVPHEMLEFVFESRE